MARRIVYARIQPIVENKVGSPGTLFKTLHVNPEEGRAIRAALNCMFHNLHIGHAQFTSPKTLQKVNMTLTQLEASISVRSQGIWTGATYIFNDNKSPKRYRITTRVGDYTFASIAFLHQFREVCSWFGQESSQYFTKIYDTVGEVDVELRNGRLVPVAGQVPKDKPKVSRPRAPKKVVKTTEYHLGNLVILPPELLVHIFSFCPPGEIDVISSINPQLKELAKSAITVLSEKPSFTVLSVLQYNNVREVYRPIRVTDEKKLDEILARNLRYMILDVSWISSMNEIVDWILTHNDLQYVKFIGQGMTFSYSPENGGTICYYCDKNPNRTRDDGRNENFAQLRRLTYSTLHINYILDERLVEGKEITRLEYVSMHNLKSISKIARKLKTLQSIIEIGEGSSNTWDPEYRRTPILSVVEFLAPLTPGYIEEYVKVFPNLTRVGVYLVSISALSTRKNLEEKIEWYKSRCSDKEISYIARAKFQEDLDILLKKLERDNMLQKNQEDFQELQKKYPHIVFIPMYTPRTLT